MSDMKLTKDRMLTFSGHEKISTLKAGEKLTEFGDRQNKARVNLPADRQLHAVLFSVHTRLCRKG